MGRAVKFRPVRRPFLSAKADQCPSTAILVPACRRSRSRPQSKLKRSGSDSTWLASAQRLLPAAYRDFTGGSVAGFGGEMRYLSDRATAYEHPRHVLDGVKSIVLLAVVYRTTEPVGAGPGEGRVSRYAWGVDYHELIHERLDRLSEFLKHEAPRAVRGVVDTAPLLDGEFAQLAGLGWIGKNTLLLNKQLGSWFFLAALLTDQELDYDEPHTADHCGTCRACPDACPTGAFVQPYVLDAGDASAI